MPTRITNSNNLFSKLTNKDALALIEQIGSWFKDLPHLPPAITNFLVTVAPWGVGLGGFLSFVGSINHLGYGLGIGMISSLNFYAGISPVYFFLLATIQFLLAILAFAAFSYLRERKLTGWIYLFWSNVLSLIEYLLALIFVEGSILAFLLSTAIGFYVLFEIKPSYESETKKTKQEKKTNC